jgi:hypothetical protein
MIQGINIDKFRDAQILLAFHCNEVHRQIDSCGLHVDQVDLVVRVATKIFELAKDIERLAPAVRTELEELRKDRQQENGGDAVLEAIMKQSALQ